MVEAAFSGTADKPLALVDRSYPHFRTVEHVEQPRGDPREPLAAVDQGMVARQGLQKCGSLLMEGRVGVAAKHGRLRARKGCLQQAPVTDLRIVPQRGAGGGQKVLQIEIVGHCASRSSSSASSATIRANAASRTAAR